MFWDRVWKNQEIIDYEKYIRLDTDYTFLKLFKESGIKNVCDAACGFGKYSVICGKNGFTVSGFDISKYSVDITKNMLNKFGIKSESYIVCGITDIAFNNEAFDGVVAHSVIDHLTFAEAQKAVIELLRIVKIDGIIYISFDGIEDDDIKIPHIVLEDGSFKYKEGEREEMIFRYYKDEEIENMFEENEILYFNTKKNGEREIIIKKIKNKSKTRDESELNNNVI